MTPRFLTICSALFIAALPLWAQQATELKQQRLSKWNIGTGNFSGIAPMGNGRYAVVSDKEPQDGFFVFNIAQNSATGQVERVSMEGFYGNPDMHVDANGVSLRDCEGVAYCPASQTVFISGEGDQQILEYNLQGGLTGRRLNVPAQFGLDKIVANYGFESLTYCPEQHAFWTMTESMLVADGQGSSPVNPGAANLLRLLKFDDNLQSAGQYAYRMDRGRTEDFGRIYVHGVSDVTMLPDGTLLVLEREANITPGYMGSEMVCKVFAVNPSQSWQIDSRTSLATLDANKFMVKRLLATFRTQLSPFNKSLANYEGMCLGAKLADGRQTVLLISDSQNGAGNRLYHLYDYIKVLVLPADL